MIDRARALRGAGVSERWIAETSHNSAPWEIIVEPDSIDRLLVVITAYPVSES